MNNKQGTSTGHTIRLYSRRREKYSIPGPVSPRSREQLSLSVFSSQYQLPSSFQTQCVLRIERALSFCFPTTFSILVVTQFFLKHSFASCKQFRSYLEAGIICQGEDSNLESQRVLRQQHDLSLRTFGPESNTCCVSFPSVQKEEDVSSCRCHC